MGYEDNGRKPFGDKRQFKPRGQKKPQMRRLDAHEKEFIDCIKSQRQITLLTLNNHEHIGTVSGFDKYCVILQTNTGKRVFFKHAIESFG